MFNKISKPVFILLILTLLGACESEVPTLQSGPGPGGPPRAMGIEGFVPQAATVRNVIEATGNLVPNEEVDIVPEISGKLIKINFQEGTFINAGKFLAKIDDTQLLAQAKKLKIALELAQTELERGQKLLAVQGTTQEEVDRLANQIKSIEADLNINKVQQNKTRIYAPFSGMLGIKQVSLGAYVSPSTPLVTLQQIRPIKLEFDVPEKFIPLIKDGQTLSFTVQGSDQTFEATVITKGTEVSPLTRTFKVRAITPNPERTLIPGQFASVALVTSVNEQAVMIPTDAVIPVLNGKIVYLAKNGKAVATPVETNDRDAEQIQITQGVVLGDTVIVSGLLALSDGAPIQVSSFKEQQ